MSWLDAIGWAGSALLVFSLLQTRVLRFRVLNLTACVVLAFFNAAIGVWPMAAQNVVLAAINVYFLVSLLRERHDDDAFEVLQVGTDDGYLRHVLDLHSDDIVAFQPDFTGPQPGERAFIVVKGDETVGVVVVAGAGDVAHVRLDYVTPRYRDFTPGEFLWRRSGLLNGLGYRQVITPPNMVGAYYDRVGFRRDGSAFVLDLPAA